MHLKLACLFFATLLCSQNAFASKSHTHDGFYLRLTPGVGGLNISDDNTEISGGAGKFSLQLGGSLSPDWILFGEVASMMAQDPTLKVNGQEIDTSDFDVTAGWTSAGIGATRYWQSGTYITFGARFPVLRFETKFNGQTNEAESDSGFSGFFAVGREWWVSENWGLGVGGEFEAGSVKEDENEINLGSVSIYFSATYH
ncbi:MAG: hypothetical protein CMH52_13640 [Myxococcales bacterium]|nr:hypothetical protein [Myxococcales bacterium]